MHTGERVGGRQRTLSTYTIHQVLGQPTIFRATEQISLIRAAWNTYARPTEGRPCDPHTWWIARRGLRRTPFSSLPRPLPRSTTFGQFLFIVSPLRSFNSRFSWWSSLVIAVESSVNQGTACKRLDRGERYCDGIWIDFAKRFTGTTLVERG